MRPQLVNLSNLLVLPAAFLSLTPLFLYTQFVHMTLCYLLTGQ